MDCQPFDVEWITDGASLLYTWRMDDAYLAARETCETAGWDTNECRYAQRQAYQEEENRDRRRRRMWATGVLMQTQ